MLAIGIVLVLWGLITHGTYAGTGDEPHYQMIAHSIVFDGDVDLANDYADSNNLVFGGQLDPGDHARPGKDGRLRPVHDIGLPLIFSPYFAVAYRAVDLLTPRIPASWLARAKLNGTVLLRHLLSMAMIGLTAWIGLQLFDVFAGISNRRNRALFWAALLVLSPPLLSHSFLFFTEILSAVLVLWVFLRLRRPHLRDWEAVLAGVATGYLLLVHIRNAGLVVALLGLGMYRLWWPPRERRLFVWFAGGAAISLGLRTWVTYHFWGTWLTTPHARLEAPAGSGAVFAEMATRLLGWFIDQEHGLLPFAPVYALLPLGWFVLWKRDRQLCLQLVCVIATYFATLTLPFINVHGWRGGWTPAARFLVPVIPLFGIVTFSGVAALPRLPLLVRALVAAQLILDAVLWQNPKLLWNDGDGVSTLLSYFDGGTGSVSGRFPSLAAPLNRTMVASLIVGAALWLWFNVWLAQRARRMRPQS